MMSSGKAEALQILQEHKEVAVRVALRRKPEGDWYFHTFVIDAMPLNYVRDSERLQAKYELSKFLYKADSAIFFASIENTDSILAWFRPDEVVLDISDGLGTGDRVLRVKPPTFQDAAQRNQFYSRTMANDGFDRMLWPHEMFTFYPLQQITDTGDTAPITVKSSQGVRPMKSFKHALMTFVYGVQNWEMASRRSADRQFALRVVRENPYLESVQALSKQTIEVSVFGRVRVGTSLHLDAGNGLLASRGVQVPGKYELSVAGDLTRQGELVLMVQDSRVDEYDWDERWHELPHLDAPAQDSNLSNPRTHAASNETVGTSTRLDSEQAVPPLFVEQSGVDVPPEIQDSLARFQQDHPDAARTGFIMMRFGKTRAHGLIVKAIKSAASTRGLVAVRADDKEYHSELYYNILTYMHGCGFGIAVFERLEQNEFNPNVALEVGYMLAQQKKVCLLKDSTLDALQADLMGRLYRPFDPQKIQETLSSEFGRWLTDHGLAEL